MSFLGFNVGTDLSLSIQNVTTGAAVTLDGRRTSFEDSDNDKVLESSPIDQGGIMEIMRIPGTKSGAVSVDRRSSDFEDLVALLDAAYYSGAPRTQFTIQVTKPSADGTKIAVYQYTGVQFHGYSAGTWERDTIVKPRVQFTATQKLKVQ